jgi:hypothetical protein
MGGLPACGLGEELTTPHVLHDVTQGLDLGGFSGKEDETRVAQGKGQNVSAVCR